jgi:hypothetical protein
MSDLLTQDPPVILSGAKAIKEIKNILDEA